MPNIVGIGGSIHDFSSCVITNDKKVFAIEDERIIRERFAISALNPCYESFRYCLESANLSIDDIDIVAANDALKPLIDEALFPNVHYHNHHMTHAYSVFFTSSFNEAAILVVDGAGSELIDKSLVGNETVTYAYGILNEIKLLGYIKGDLSGTNPVSQSETLMSNSLGEFYRAVSQSIGFNWLSGPGKMMGMVSYSLGVKDETYKYIKNELGKNIKFLPNGNIRIDINGEGGLVDTLFRLTENRNKESDKFIFNAKLACVAQDILEAMLIHFLDYLHKVTQSNNLCIVGGVALNSLALGKIIKKSKFKKIHAFFAPGDNGTAIGAAIKEYIELQPDVEQKCRFDLKPYLGRNYTKEEIIKSLKIDGIAYEELPDIKLYQTTAKMISEGNVIAWFQGPSEFGPRALGNRSILADPRNSDMRERINSLIKKREWFRPFAPAIIEEFATDFFEIGCNSPWMQFVFNVRSEFHTVLPAITHVDNTARVQTVNKNDNEKFYSLLQAYKSLTGIPVLLNTSFNINGEPIVESPIDAVTSFISSEIDILIINNFLIKKIN